MVVTKMSPYCGIVIMVVSLSLDMTAFSENRLIVGFYQREMKFLNK